MKINQSWPAAIITSAWMKYLPHNAKKIWRAGRIRAEEEGWLAEMKIENGLWPAEEMCSYSVL